MSAKLFSFIGTGRYTPVHYHFLNQESSVFAKYVQEAIVELIDEDLEVFICLTDQAREKHWQETDSESLLRVFQSNNVRYHEVPIPSGKDADEAWAIFDAVYNCIEEGDRVYIDITHSFRMIPVLLMSVIQYAKTTKKITVEQILYGAFDAQVDGYAPIYDITFFDVLSDWSHGVDQMLRTGEPNHFIDTSNRHLLPILKQYKGKSELATVTRNIVNYIEGFFNDLKFSRGKTIINDGIQLKAYLQSIKDLEAEYFNVLKPFYNLLQQISNQVAFFNEEDTVCNMHGCVKLCRDYGMIQQAYTLLQENIVNDICLKLDLELFDHKSGRRYAEKLIVYHYDYSKMPGRNQISLEADERVLKEQLSDKFTTEMAELHHKISDYRNDLNHAGYRPDPKVANKLTEVLNGFIADFERLYIGEHSCR